VLLVARHADARFVQEFLGHSRITTTKRYMHAKARPEDLERVNLAFATCSKPALNCNAGSVHELKINLPRSHSRCKR
jgi:hypothetical protein